MVDPFGEISFLTRSENRVTVLMALADTPSTERRLVDETGISDVTAGRILKDFAERGWIREDDGTYRMSAVGELIADDYRRLEDSVDLACRLGPVLEYLPLEEIDFDLRHLTDARVSDPGRFEPIRAVDRWTELVQKSDHVVGIAPVMTATTVVAEAFHEEITENDLRFEMVVSAEYVETVRERPELHELIRDQIRAGAEFYEASEEADPLPFVATFDDLATISGYDETGTLQVGIETRAEPVYEWIRGRYESYREEATPLSVGDLTR